MNKILSRALYALHADSARLHFTGLSYRFYDKVLPVTYMLAKYGRGSISLQSPVTYGVCSASFKDNLINDDSYLRCDSVTIIVLSFGQIEQGAH